MKRLMFALVMMFFVGTGAAQVKYVAVVETEVDAQSGAATKLNKAEVRQITTVLRNEARNNLPSGKYKIMTAETVIAQGSAKLEECAEENCVIALGAKIGADYIVRGIVSKLGTNLTMSVEMYETEDGNLVATSGIVRSENIAELVDKAAAVCADMYKTFVSTQRPARKTAETLETPATPSETPAVASVTPTETPTAPVKPSETPKTPKPPKPPKPPKTPKPPKPQKEPIAQSEPQTVQERKPMTGFSVGSSFSLSNDGHLALQLGAVHSRPITEKVLSLNVEGNIWVGKANISNEVEEVEAIGFFGFNVPITALMHWKFLSFEAGANADLIFGDNETLFNAGLVIGAGVEFDKKLSRRYFYRYCGGYKFGAHVVGMRWLF